MSDIDDLTALDGGFGLMTAGLGDGDRVRVVQASGDVFECTVSAVVRRASGAWFYARSRVAYWVGNDADVQLIGRADPDTDGVDG